MWHQEWPDNDFQLLKTKTLKLRFLIFILLAIKMLKIPNFDVTFFKKIRSFLIILFMLDLSTPASPADFHCNLFWWFVTILAFVDLSKFGILTDRGCPVFLMVSTEFVSWNFLTWYATVPSLENLSYGRVINDVNNPWVRIISLP